MLHFTNTMALIYSQLQTSWLGMFRQFVWVTSAILFCRSYPFQIFYQLSVEVSLVKMPPKRTIE